MVNSEGTLDGSIGHDLTAYLVNVVLNGVRLLSCNLNLYSPEDKIISESFTKVQIFAVSNVVASLTGALALGGPSTLLAGRPRAVHVVLARGNAVRLASLR